MRTERPDQIPMHLTDVQRNFSEVVNRIVAGHEHIIVERDGLPVIVMLSVAEYQLLMRERELRAERLKKFEASARRIGQAIESLGLREEEVMAQLEETKQEVYDEHYGSSNRSTSGTGH